MKQIVTSATYMQSAIVTKEHLQKDPENVYLSRANRIRLKAELVRDLYLSSSGLLVKTIGGPSVKPYQPAGIWESTTSGRGVLADINRTMVKIFIDSGMYTFIKLTVPPPGMIMFDASNRDQCEVKRLQTNTPLQALIMMNDPAVLEAARVFSQRLANESSTPTEKIIKAFQKYYLQETYRQRTKDFD